MRRLLAPIGLLAGACAVAPAPQDLRAVRWRGEVRVEGEQSFPRGSSLTIEPGTVVRFAFRDDDGDGWGDAGLRIEGDLRAEGSAGAPIVFTCEEEPVRPGCWGEIRVDFGSFALRHAVVEGSTRGMHSHFSRGRIEDSVFRHNVDGTRLGESTVDVERCLFYGHEGKAFNARLCRNRVRGNLFRGNRNAIFLFEADTASEFAGNRFRDNQNPFRLGDFFEGMVEAAGNDWGGMPPPPPEPGATTGVRASSAEVAAAGPRGWPRWEPLWRTPTQGFADAPPVLADDGIYGADWGGQVFRLGFLDGTVLSAVRLPDAVDSPAAVGPSAVAVSCWDRGIYLLQRGSLRVLDSFIEDPSPADDHRQAGAVFLGETLVAATWAGFVRAFDTSAGRLEPRWAFRAEGPFRADLIAAGNPPVVVAPSQDGALYALEPSDGRLRWSYAAGAALVSAAATDGSSVFAADREGVLHAVRLADGEPAWKVRLGGAAWYAPCASWDGIVFQGDDSGRLWAVDSRTGRVLWQRPLGAGIRARPAPAGPGLVAVPTSAGRLFLLDAATGMERDCVDMGQAAFGGATAAAGGILVGGRDASVRFLRVQTEPGPDEAP